MSIFNKTNGIELTQDDLQDAKTTAALFSDELIKKRAFANVIAARSALRLLFSFNIEATNLYSMYSINKVLEALDIADIYVGDIKIDARIVNDENEIFIPKSHFQLGIQPDLYLVLKLEKDLSGVEFLGCINPEEMDKTKENRDYYFVDEEILYNLKIFKNLVKSGKSSQNFITTSEDMERAQNLIVPFEDDDIFNADKEFFLQQLAHNAELRKKTIEFENFEFVSKKVVTEETVYGDSVLGLVGSEKLYDRGEFTTDINLDELSDATVDDFVESFKDESFEGETPQDPDEEDVLTDEFNYEDINFENDFDIEDNDNSKSELEDILNEMTSFEDNVDVSESQTEEDIEELTIMEPSIDEPTGFSEMDSDEGEADLSFVSTLDYPENIESMRTPISPSSSQSVSMPEEEDDEEEDDEDDEFEFESVDFDANAPIDFDEGGFELPDLGGFSFDNMEEITEDDSDIGFVNDETVEQENNYEEVAIEAEAEAEGEDDSDEPHIIENPKEEIQKPELTAYEDDDDPDISDLPTLKIFQESPDTYKKKMYKAPAIDDINMQDINLDDFDDYEQEDKEKEDKENEEFDEMISDLDNILSSDSLPIDSVDEILTDDELSESLKNLEQEISNENSAQEEYSEMEISENSPTLQQQENSSESGMSLDDFLNSSSFNEMSTKQDVGDNIENNGIENIYQNDGNMQNTQDVGLNNESETTDSLLTDEASMVDNSASFYGEDTIKETVKVAPKRKSNTPTLLAVLVVLLCIFAYTRKDDIMANFNVNMGSKEEVPEFDLNKLREPQPAPEVPNPADSPIPTIPQPTDMPVDQGVPGPPVATNETPMPLNTPHPGAEGEVGARPTSQNVSNKITKISWEVPENMASNAKIRKYLQIAGRTLRLSLQNDLLVATELPFSNRIMLDLKIAPSGNLIMSDFVISSGSKQIDSIVLQSVKDTLKYVRPPLGEIQSPNSNFSLIINF